MLSLEEAMLSNCSWEAELLHRPRAPLLCTGWRGDRSSRVRAEGRGGEGGREKEKREEGRENRERKKKREREEGERERERGRTGRKEGREME